ncbi:hypothetical protein M0R45_011338 [Rubus argutus]|uniref:TIR domain-containing protein n=1 Tax=Rubus argutus TaxID=59490 RepID=A0AAW1YAM1_RUBAR
MAASSAVDVLPQQKERYGQIVIPVFYDIDPSHVRRQQGTYANAFASLEERFKDNMDKVNKWRQALTTAANLSGFHSQNIRPEAELIETIVEDISMKLHQPGKRKRLWNAEDGYRVFNNNTGSSTVEAIFLDVSKIQELQLSPAAFRSMQNLKLLKFYATQEVQNECKRQRRWTVGEKQQSSFPWLPGVKAVRSFLAKSRIWGSISLLDVYRKVCNYDDEFFSKYCNVYLHGGLESLPEELRYLYWDGYPLKSLPSQYSPHNLVELHMPNSQVKQLWTNGQNLVSLKHLNLCNSRNLIEVPDLSGSPNIERIDLGDCTSLVGVPSYFQNLENLASLDLQYCRNLKFFCEIPCNLEELNLSGTAIEEISPSIWSHKKLHTLDLTLCENLKSLPSRSNSTTGELNLCGGDQNQIGLKILRLRCSNIESLPDDSIYGLDTLDLDFCTRLKRLPPLSMGSLCSLRKLDLSRCEVLESIPDSLFCSSTLQNINLSYTMIESIPSSIINASGLRHLRLWDCKKLKVIPELPSQLQNLEAYGCTSLKRVASSRSALVQQPWEHREGFIGECLVYTECLELDESARSNIMADAQLRIMRMTSSWNRARYDFHFICPGNEIPGWFSDQREGCEINNIKFPPDWSTTTTPDQFLGFPLSAVVAVKPLGVVCYIGLS